MPLNILLVSKLSAVLNKETCNSISTVEITTSDIFKIIRNVNLNKPHSHDIISIPVLEICDESIFKLLAIIFWSCLKKGKYLSEWKIANMVPVFKTSNKLSPYFFTSCFRHNI